MASQGEGAHLLLTGRDLVATLARELERRHAAKSPITGLRTGLAHFDSLTSGLQPGEMTVIAGRPGGGKTAIALEMVRRMALPKRGEAATPVLFVSLEMSARALAERLTMAMSSLTSSTLRRADFIQSELEDFRRAAHRIQHGGLTVFDATNGLTKEDLGELVGKWKSEQPRPGVVVVDYLQLLRSSKRQPSREREVAEASMACRAAARANTVPVIALAQLNRGLADRQDPRPRATDLRESGQIEQDADVIALLHTPPTKPGEPKSDQLDLIIEKNRNGAQGTVKLRFDYAHQTIHEVIEDL